MNAEISASVGARGRSWTGMARAASGKARRERSFILTVTMVFAAGNYRLLDAFWRSMRGARSHIYGSAGMETVTVGHPLNPPFVLRVVTGPAPGDLLSASTSPL